MNQEPKESKEFSENRPAKNETILFRIRNGILHGIGLSIGVAGSYLLAVSVTLNTFSPGTPISASKVNENFTNLKTAVESVVPVGTIFAYSGTTAPNGFLLCNGNAYPKSTYPDLAALLEITNGSRFGSPDPSTFRVPDLRGRFLRGVNDNSGNDLDAGTRYQLYTGGAAGDNIGSYQDESFKKHQHGLMPGNGVTSGQCWWNGTGGFADCNYSTPAVYTQSFGGNETRPKNVYVNYIIKY